MTHALCMPDNLRLQTLAQNMSYTWLYHGNSGYANAPQCYVICCLCILLDDWHTIPEKRLYLKFYILNSKCIQLLGCVVCAVVFIQRLRGLCYRLHAEVAWFVLSSSCRSCMVCAVVFMQKLHGLCCRLHTEVAWFVLSSSYRSCLVCAVCIQNAVL
jgi:hypothetical protein